MRETDKLTRSTCILQEIENLKQKTETLQSELLKREEDWLKEKQDLIILKDEERRKAVAVIQDQNETEYKQFIAEHKDTLDHALKAAREQHSQEKVRHESSGVARKPVFSGFRPGRHKPSCTASEDG